MIPATKDPVRIQMRKDMEVAFEHFKLSAEARKVARDSAEKRIHSAAACYRAVARSLEVSPSR